VLYSTLAYSKEILKPGKPVLEGAKNKDNNMTTDPLQICSSAVLGRLYSTGRDGVVATRYGLEVRGWNLGVD